MLSYKRILIVIISICCALGAAHANAVDMSFMQKIAARIKSNTMFAMPAEEMRNDAVEYRVSLNPDGTIASVEKIKSSVVPGFDKAALRAIELSQPYPKDKSGKVPEVFTIVHRPM